VQFRRRLLLKSLKLTDLFLVSITFMLVTWVFYAHDNDVYVFDEFLQLRIKIENAILGGAMVLAWHLVLSSFGLYESKRLSSLKGEIRDILLATLAGTSVIAALTVVFSIQMVSAGFLPVFWVTVSVLTILSRVCLRLGLGWIRRKGRNLRQVLIVGTNHRALHFAEEITSRPELGYRLVGFADDQWNGLTQWNHDRLPLVSSLENLAGFLRTYAVDEVLITLPMRSYYQPASHIVAQCEEQGILVRVLGDLFTPKLAKPSLDELGGHSTFTLHTGAIGDKAILIKRIIDVLVAAPALVLLSPLFGVIAVAIKLTSPGPVFFIQERIGLNKRRFRCLKFRTMVPDAERQQAELEHLNEVHGAAFKVMHDPRITPIGRFLRKTSFDELPQFINVLKGDMSLVGPRPLPVRDFHEFSEDWHRRRFSVRPGLTCLWQVNGRSSLSFEKWMELDLEYIDQWSLLLDLKILFKTIPAVIRGTGAA
jgi:exopolysaccharide biosynthesis polyprenyl glycosylphosphotransferase